MIFIAYVVLSFFYSVNSQKAVSKSSGPPAFFLQDAIDGQCLAGEKYKRCAIDTLWYVTGKPGTYQIHKRKIDETEDDVCLDKMHCHLDESETRVSNCQHCGAKKWNILGDSDTGYVLTEDGNKNCIKRTGDLANVIKCDKGYSRLTLQFATKDDITAMSSDGARLITAAADNDVKVVEAFLGDSVNVNSRDWDNLTALIAASGKGHLTMVKLLVSHKADPNLKDKDNITAVMESSMNGHRDVVDYLVSVGAVVDVTAASGVSPLWLAAGEGHSEVVKVLLSKGADPNNKRSDGITALMAAAGGGHAEVVKSLLGAGATVDNKDKEGLTALISAAENGSLPIIQMLLEKGAEVNVISTNGFSPLIIACAHGHVEVVKTLLASGAEIEMEHPEAVTALMYASAGGHPDVVKLLLEKGAKVNLRHSQGGSALMEAATSGNMTVVQLLLDAGADPLAVDKDGVTTLMSAASQGHTEIVKLLVKKGLDVNKVANSGGTALMFAAGGGHNETTRVLLDHKANVNVVVQATPEYVEQVAKAIAEGKEDVEPHRDGVTALIVAAQGGHMGTVKMLVEAKADVRAVDDEDFTPLLSAIKGNYGAVASYLVEKGANPNDVFIDEKKKPHNLLMDAIMVNNTDFAVLLINKGANITYADEDGVTISTQAAFQGMTKVVETLISKKADLSVGNKEGINPLIAAASEGRFEVVKLLVEKGKVNLNAKDKDGTNALMAAAVRGHKDVVAFLVKKGAEVNSQNVDGHSALMFAYNGKNQVQTLLDKYGEYMKDKADNSTKIIREALQTHIDVVDTLLKHGADPALKDKEGHVAGDFDYKPPEVIPVAGSITPDKEL
eukprot:gene3068-6016_t